MGDKLGGISQVAIKLIQTNSAQNAQQNKGVEPQGLQQSIGKVAEATEAVKTALSEAAQLSVRASNRSQPVRDLDDADSLASNIAGDVSKLDKEGASAVHNLTNNAVTSR